MFFLYFFVGVCCNCRVLFVKMESKEELEVEIEVMIEEFVDDIGVFFFMENLFFVSS